MLRLQKKGKDSCFHGATFYWGSYSVLVGLIIPIANIYGMCNYRPGTVLIFFLAYSSTNIYQVPGIFQTILVFWI